MSRDLDAGLEAAIEEQVVRPFLALRIDTPDPVYVFTGTGTMSFPDADGVTREWIGAGDVGAIDTLGETTDGTASGFKATLFRVPAEFRDDIADQAVPGVKVDVGLGAFDVTYQTLEGFSWLNRFKLDEFKITDAGDTLSVQVSGENRAIDKNRPAIKRFTDEAQQRAHAGDKFFEFVSQMAEISILWAKAELPGVVSGGSSSGGFGGMSGASDGGGRFYGNNHT